jgi:CHAT domain-containing protein
MSKETFIKIFSLFILTTLFMAGCAAKMTLEEAKKVSISMDSPSFMAPSRHINDILEVLDQSGKYDDKTARLLTVKAAKIPPANADDKTMAAFYHERGEAARQLGHTKQAIDDLRTALSYAQKAGINNPALLRHLGGAEKVSGNFRRAVDLFERALEIKDDMGTYENLIDTYIKMGDLETAKRMNIESINAYNEKRRKKNVDRNSLARDAHMSKINHLILEAEGKHSEAEKHIRRELELYHSQKDQNPRSTVVSRITLASNLNHQDRLIEAEIEARQSISESLGLGGADSELAARAVLNLARILLNQNRINDVRKLSQTSIRIMEASGMPADSYAMCNVRMFLGNVLSQEEDFKGAMEQYDLAREGMTENRGLYEANFARNPNLMLTLLKMNRGDEAMSIISKVYEANRINYGEKNAQTIRIRGLRGMAYALAGNNKMAVLDFSAALPVLMGRRGKITSETLIRSSRIILESYIDFLAGINGTATEKELGISAADEAFRIVSFLSGQTTQTALGESSARAAASYDPELSDLVRKEQDSNKQTKALEAILSEALMAPPNQQDPKAIKAMRESINILTKARTLLFDEINRRFPKYANFTSPQPVTLEMVRKNLRQNEAMISIFSTVNKTYSWAIPQAGEKGFSVANWGKKDIDQIVSKLRKALDASPDTLGDIPAFDLTGAYSLYERLLKPVEPSWRSSKNLLITVNGSLGQLPLALLPTEPIVLSGEKELLFANYRQVSWLVRKASVTMLPSVNALLTLRSLPDGDSSRKAFAGFGDPIFNREQLGEDQKTASDSRTVKGTEETPQKVQLASRGIKMHVRGIRLTDKGHLDSGQIASAQLDKLDRLPDTSEELKSIARVLGSNPDNDVFLGKNCSKHRIQTMNLSDRKVIAFATHALVPGDLDGLDQPALALSSPSVTGEKEDGLLKMDEILKLKLSADWVVLSACNTGAAAGQGAEAVSGLGKAFFYAGTRALLVTMWPVETTSARKLVTGTFQYQNDDKSLSRAQALRKSMLNLLDQEYMKDEATGKVVSSYAHPLFWAPFVMIGEPGTDRND